MMIVGEDLGLGWYYKNTLILCMSFELQSGDGKKKDGGMHLLKYLEFPERN